MNKAALISKLEKLDDLIHRGDSILDEDRLSLMMAPETEDVDSVDLAKAMRCALFEIHVNIRNLMISFRAYGDGKPIDNTDTLLEMMKDIGESAKIVADIVDEYKIAKEMDALSKGQEIWSKKYIQEKWRGE
jgi:hypothetical protein